MLYTFELCKGRHSTPAERAIFENEVDPTNISALQDIADAAIPEDCTILRVYVTGLTVAMLAVVNVCLNRDIVLLAMHYNRETEAYYQQVVVSPGVVECQRLAEKVLAAVRPWYPKD